MEGKDVSGRDVTSGAEPPEAALEDAAAADAPGGAEITAGEAAPEEAAAAAPAPPPDPDATAG